MAIESGRGYTPYSKMATTRKKLARVERKRGHKGRVIFVLFCIYSVAKKTSLEAKENGNYIVTLTGQLSYSYSTQTGPYVFVQLAPGFFRVAAILE